ncbi:MAG: hypothetical protein ACRBB6_10470 [Neptuniibacter sp.]
MLKQVITSILVLISVLSSVFASADALDGEKHIFLLDKKGNEIQVGSVTFHVAGGETSYKLHMEHEKFKDYFLSMKEMKCLEGPELMCHLAYPYQQPNTVTAEDLTWLSHDLLFMFKKPAEFGANFWNGVYYNMRVEEGVIKGVAEAVDLNLLASPPDDLNVPPMHEGERDEIDRAKRWLPDLVIR